MEKVERSSGPKGKIHSRDEFELCYLRHRYLRKSLYNPSEEDIAPYIKIINAISRRTYYYYRYLFTTVGFEIDDIISIGKTHFVSFIGLFEISETKNHKKYQEFVTAYQKRIPGILPNESEILDKNKANFTLFLKQRMDDLVRICKQKAKNIRGLKIDDYAAFCGPESPPEDLYKLLEEYDEFNYKPIDNVRFKSVKKKAKVKDIKDPFKFEDLWYAAVFLEKRELTMEDLQSAGLDPRDGEHNMTPEQILIKQYDEKWLDKITKMFKNYTKDQKVAVLNGFIEKNEQNSKFSEEIQIAKSFLSRMGVKYVGKQEGES